MSWSLVLRMFCPTLVCLPPHANSILVSQVSIAGHEAAEPSVALRRFIISKELKAELIQEMERVANLADSHLLREIVPAPVMLLCKYV